MRKPSKKSITEKDRSIYNALLELSRLPRAQYQKPGFGSTQIGVRVGRDRYDASSYCTLSLKKLIEFGYVKKLPNGRYIPKTNVAK